MLAEDVEPEYIAFFENSRIAWVSLQDNKGIARINIRIQTIEVIYPLGFKDFSLPGNSFDASDEDGVKLLNNSLYLAYTNRMHWYQPKSEAKIISSQQMKAMHGIMMVLVSGTISFFENM